MKPSTERRPSAMASTVLAALLPLLGACATSGPDDDNVFSQLALTGPVVIPLGPGGPGGDPAMIDVYYQSIVAQMQQAVAERDLDWIDMLLAQHDRELAPSWARTSMVGFRRVAVALRQERRMQQVARLGFRGGTPELGAGLACELIVQGGADAAFRLPGRDEDLAPARFLVHLRFEDRDCSGGRGAAEFEDIVTLEQGVDLDRETPLRLPFDVDPPPVNGCERRVELRCELLPGARYLDGEPVPGHRMLLVEQTFDVYPRGIEAVLKDPLATLRAAIDRQDPRYFDHVWLASRHMPGEQRDAACEILIRAVRLGPSGIARVAGACLVEMTGLQIPPGDRDGWLAWWQAQVRERR